MISHGPDASLSAEAQTALDTAYEGIGSDLADLTAVTPESGRVLYVVSCGEQVPSCAVPAAGVKSAADSDAFGDASHPPGLFPRHAGSP
ncbi:hypothetical protein FB562_1507 [Homoserinimonas aerilata]|uniref:Uncharacterized protein n=1 Tax=Homoserinimonas aerilata TaxID=1162970 RepID=A0A542YJY7_9MICO|nr:hypothetical protein [Homoserinimonas aerilata]TQL48413.1 hypothetical protein FB562_1507 [Homoserinimonas aerilata]